MRAVKPAGNGLRDVHDRPPIRDLLDIPRDPRCTSSGRDRQGMPPAGGRPGQAQIPPPPPPPPSPKPAPGGPPAPASQAAWPVAPAGRTNTVASAWADSGELANPTSDSDAASDAVVVAATGPSTDPAKSRATGMVRTVRHGVAFGDAVTGPTQHPDQIPMVIVMSDDGGARQFGRVTARRTLPIGQVMAQPQQHSLPLLLGQSGERLMVDLLDDLRRGDPQAGTCTWRAATPPEPRRLVAVPNPGCLPRVRTSRSSARACRESP